MKTNILLFIICFWNNLTPTVCLGQKTDNYTLSISKKNKDAANIHVSCSFTVDFQSADSISLNFGGATEFSIDKLTIQESPKGLLKYEYRKDAKKLILYKSSSQKMNIRMDYDYTNLTSFFIYGKGDAEIWETSFGEYYYPYLPNTYINMFINSSVHKSMLLISSYPMVKDKRNNYSCQIKNMLTQSLSLAFINKKAYTKSTIDIPKTTSVYQIRNMQCNPIRYKELSELSSESIRYFSNIYKEEYISDLQNITSYPIFLFHNGEGFSNRYNIGFISASQEKFSTYPDIYPLIHEIGHRWLGEWSLLINDGQPGAYFLKESLNEFMTFMFIRNYLGEEIYKGLISQCKEKYQKIKNTINDVPLIEITVNNNNVIVYNKGPLILDYIAQKIGYDNLIERIALFYQLFARKQPLYYNDFIETLGKKYPEAGKELDTMIRNR